MKKIRLILLLTLPLLFSFTNNDYNSTVNEKRVLKNNSDEEFLKRIINQIEAAEKALEYLEKANQQQNYLAVVTVNRNEQDKFGNSIIISLTEEKNTILSPICNICGISKISNCLRKINKENPLGDEFTVKVKIEEGSVKLFK